MTFPSFKSRLPSPSLMSNIQTTFIHHLLSLVSIVSISVLLPIPSFAGQDAAFTNAFTLANASVPAQSGHCTVEFAVSNQTATPSSSTWFSNNPCGISVQWNGVLLESYWRTGSAGGGVTQTGLGTGMYIVRIQVDPATLTQTMDIWDQTCTLYFTQSQIFTAATGSASATGQSLIGNSTGFKLSWFRLSTDAFAAGSSCPTTAATGRNFLAHWKFDGNLMDSSANGLNLTCSGSCSSQPSYTATLSSFQTLVIPSICVSLCSAAPAYNSLLPAGIAISARAGQTTTLDGSGSFSETDASSNVSLFWQMLSAPSLPRWSSQSASIVTINGLIFGDYNWQVTATDMAGNVGTTSGHIGSTATDNNGVVVNANPQVDYLLGNMIGFGNNPWGFADYWQAHAMNLRTTDYAATVNSGGQSYPGWSTNGAPQWETMGTGTISYNFNCAGLHAICNRVGTTLSGPLSPTDTTITVNNSSLIDLTSFPTRVIVYDGTNTDDLRICSSTSNTLTMCYDPTPLTRHSFVSGTDILQSKVIGNGTQFINDPVTAVCPVGAPGPPGPSVYSTGSVGLTAGSATVTGSGTTFSLVAGDFIRVSATHSTTPFVFIAQILTVNSTSSLTLNRIFPVDADTASGLSYNIMPAQRTAVLQYPATHTDPVFAPNPLDLHGVGTMGCESDTALYTNPLLRGLGNSFFDGADVTGLDGQRITGVKYSIDDTGGWVASSSGGIGNINYYGEDLASYHLYFRSGLKSALTAAETISNYWVHSPWGNREANGIELLIQGGGAIGAFTSKILDPSSLVSWADLRSYAQSGAYEVTQYANGGCNVDDTRDSGYAYTWLILASIYDPDTTSTVAPGGISWNAYWRSFLPQMQTNDTNCQNQAGGTDNSFANSFYFNAGGTNALTLTNGSTAVTGTAIPAGICFGIGSGTAIVANGSNVVSVTSGSIPSGATLYLTGTSGGGTSRFFQAISYTGTGSSALLGTNWSGDSGNVTWLASSTDGDPENGGTVMLSIGTSVSDVMDLRTNWACTWNSATSVTLSGPWTGATGSGYHAYAANLSGFGQQGFMLGIKAYGSNLLATQTIPALSSYVAPYASFTGNSASFIWNSAMNQTLSTTNYGRVFQQCEPTAIPAPGTLNDSTLAGCTDGLSPVGISLGREQNAEVSHAHVLFYKKVPTNQNLIQGDKWYGALWCNSTFTTKNVFCDQNSTAQNVGQTQFADIYINEGKWYGFFTGVGKAHEWPAARLGGVQAPQPRAVTVQVPQLAGLTAQIVTTYPSGSQTTTACPNLYCAVLVDDTQGQSLFQIQYLSGGKVVGQTDVPGPLGQFSGH